MPSISMTPGTILAGRYRLDDLLSEQDGARFWRATDTVLARSVAVHAVASADPRAAAVLAAARRSAGVTEPHFLRVLDCADVDGLTWVINEWGDGVSLDVMLARGTLPPMRAAWLTREVAEAIAAAHARGEYHGRLNPEAVLVTESGSVKIIGFVVNAAFERSTTASSPYGQIGPREADVVDLAGILYAALTGRWPGIAPSGLPPAPRIGNRPMRPRQVRAGVPRTLDAICDRVLHKEASEHVLPIETAYEVAAALSDYVGDPATVAPVDVPSMHAEPERPEPTDTDMFPEVFPETFSGPVDQPGPDKPVEVLVVDEPAPGLVPLVDPDATMAGAGPYQEVGIEFLEPEKWDPAQDEAQGAAQDPAQVQGQPTPPPPFEQPADRPLFADHDRRVPSGAPGAVLPPTPDRAAPPPPAAPRSDQWPFEDHHDAPPAEVNYRSERRWLRVALITAMVLALVLGMYLTFTWGRNKDKPASTPTTSTTKSTPGSTPSTTPSTTPAPVVTGVPIKIVRVGDFDPEGDPPQENPGQVNQAIDGDRATGWHTNVYHGDPRLGGTKSGVGLIVDLGSDHTISSVELTLGGAPTELELYATAPGISDPPAELAAARQVTGILTENTTAAIRLAPAIRTRYLVVWLTKLPRVANGFQGEITEITVRP